MMPGEKINAKFCIAKTPLLDRLLKRSKALPGNFFLYTKVDKLTL